MPKNYAPNYDNLREHKRYVVLGIVIHVNKCTVMAHISSLDGFQYVIAVKALKKIGEINHNKLNEIRQNYKIDCLGI